MEPPPPPSTDVEQEAVPRAVEVQQPVDRKRDAGLRGDELTSAAVLLTIVFLAGVGVLVAVLLSRRKPGDAS